LGLRACISTIFGFIQEVYTVFELKQKGIKRNCEEIIT